MTKHSTKKLKVAYGPFRVQIEGNRKWGGGAGPQAGLQIDGFLSVNPSKSMLLKDKKNC
jgi:hypothetical protein